MGFKKTQPGGEVDPKIYRGGRSFVNKHYEDNPEATFRDLGRDELLKLYRKVKPYSKDAIGILALMMKSSSATEAGRLRAAMAFLDMYQKLVKDIYNSDELIDPESEARDAAQGAGAPVFSLTVVGGKENNNEG